MTNLHCRLNTSFKVGGYDHEHTRLLAMFFGGWTGPALCQDTIVLVWKIRFSLQQNQFGTGRYFISSSKLGLCVWYSICYNVYCSFQMSNYDNIVQLVIQKTSPAWSLIYFMVLWAIISASFQTVVTSNYQYICWTGIYACIAAQWLVIRSTYIQILRHICHLALLSCAIFSSFTDVSSLVRYHSWHVYTKCLVKTDDMRTCNFQPIEAEWYIQWRPFIARFIIVNIL